MTMSVLHHQRHRTPAPQLKPIGRVANANQDADLLHELGRRLDAIYRYDRFIAHATDRPELEAFWRDLKALELSCVDDLEELLKGVHAVNVARATGPRHTVTHTDH